MSVLHDLRIVWRTLMVIFLPVILLPILFIDGSKEMACLYAVALMAILWITEAIPLAVTSLLPVVLFPALGVMPAKMVAAKYIKDSSLFSFCCLTFACVAEKWNLHRRIALRTLLWVGGGLKWLLLGFMFPTWFISMWVNNTSATAMMLPVVIAVLQELQKLENAKKVEDEGDREKLSGSDYGGGREKLSQGSHEHTADSDIEKKSGVDRKLDASTSSSKMKKSLKAYSLCVCYAASIGGTAIINGTSTNFVMQGQIEEFFNFYGLTSGVNFLSFMLSGLPCSVLCLVVSWVFLTVHFFGFKELFSFSCGDEQETTAARKVVKRYLKDLGPLTFAEKAVLVHFVILVLAFVGMKLPGGTGWVYLFKDGYVGNSTCGIFILMSMMMFPSECPELFRPKAASRKPSQELSGRKVAKRPVNLLDWGTVQHSFPWGSFLLVNGGFAMAAACQSSGLSVLMGSKLTVLKGFEPWVMLLIITTCVSFITEITSNTATVSILTPILAEVALSLGMNPLYFVLPACFTSSVAFMLPVATPPNAIAFATGYIKTTDMVKAGFLLNLMCVLVINLGANTWMKALFDLGTIPPEMLLNNTSNFTQTLATSSPLDDNFTMNYITHSAENGTRFIDIRSVL